MKYSLTFLFFSFVLFSCNDEPQNKFVDHSYDHQPSAEAITPATAESRVDPENGIGRYTHVELTEKLDTKLAALGKQLYEAKCAACHQLNDQPLVGPGWKGTTKRNSTGWLLNYITNTTEMLEKDPRAKAQLAKFMVPMPEQNLSDDDAHALLEFMRKNDGFE